MRFFIISLFFLISSYSFADEKISQIVSAASQGEAIAQNELGYLYFIGKGVPQDYKKAFIWYRRAAEQGDSHAQTKLGLMYYIGEGIPRSYKKSYAWLNIAVSQGDATTMFISLKNELEKILTKESLLEAQQLSKEYVKLYSHGLNLGCK